MIKTKNILCFINFILIIFSIEKILTKTNGLNIFYNLLIGNKYFLFNF